MAVPDFQSFFKPLLGIAADGKEHSMKEARELIVRRMNIEKIVHALSAQLVAVFGRGFAVRNLFDTIRFAEAFPDDQIVSALRRQ